MPVMKSFVALNYLVACATIDLGFHEQYLFLLFYDSIAEIIRLYDCKSYSIASKFYESYVENFMAFNNPCLFIFYFLINF